MQNYKVSYLLQKLQMLCGTSLHCTVGSHCRDQSTIKYTFGVPLVFTASGRMATECPAFMKQVALRGGSNSIFVHSFSVQLAKI